MHPFVARAPAYVPGFFYVPPTFKLAKPLIIGAPERVEDIVQLLG